MNEITDLSLYIIKLIDTISRGVGFAFKPLFTRLQTKADVEATKLLSSADAEAIVTIAKAEADASLTKANADVQIIQKISAATSENIHLPIYYSDGLKHIDSTDINELEKRALFRLHYQEIQKERNIEAVCVNAFNNHVEDIDVPDEPVDQDWINRFFNYIGDISDEDMQKLWGRLLTGEIKQPGRFSLRTLDCLRIMSKGEALLFAKIANYIIRFPKDDDFFIPNNSIERLLKSDDLLDIGAFLAEEGISFSTLLPLEECGLIELKPLIAAGANTLTGEIIHFEYGNNSIDIKNVSEKEIIIQFHGSFLTTSGKELYGIIQPVFNLEFLNCVIENWKNELCENKAKKDEVLFEIV